MPLDIPNACVVSFKVSRLEPKDVLRVLQLVQGVWNEDCIRPLLSHPTSLVMAVGISNPHDLQRAIKANVPVLHIDSACQALKAQEHHRLTQQRVSGMEILLAAVGYPWAIGPSECFAQSKASLSKGGGRQ
ncbi:hypothetical protein BDF14DRAFT_1743340 [Spinellus fusiger]|nr:hypothetical protein BDF14DRAFT_1743340 [Spinellus fusiger]